MKQTFTWKNMITSHLLRKCLHKFGSPLELIIKKVIVAIFFSLSFYSALAQSGQSATIDSIEINAQPYMSSFAPELEVSFKVYVNNTTGISSLGITLSNDSTGSEILDTTMSGTLQVDSVTSANYYLLDAGHYHLIPAFVSSYLILSGGSRTAAIKKQLVY